MKRLSDSGFAFASVGVFTILQIIVLIVGACCLLFLLRLGLAFFAAVLLVKILFFLFVLHSFITAYDRPFVRFLLAGIRAENVFTFIRFIFRGIHNNLFLYPEVTENNPVGILCLTVISSVFAFINNRLVCIPMIQSSTPRLSSSTT